jgi:aryl-alcohol dehydrogenase-like predicted oxidoreductase
MYKEILDGKPGTPGQKAIRFIIESIEPHSIVLIATDPGKLEEYVEALRVERLGCGSKAGGNPR